MIFAGDGTEQLLMGGFPMGWTKLVVRELRTDSLMI